MTEESYACAVCGRILDEVQGVGFRHVVMDEPSDHVAVPVPRDQIPVNERCDFCLADESSHEVPARDFDMPLLPGHASKGNWAACPTCAHLIGLNQWSALHRRVVAEWIAREGSMDPLAAQGLRQLHARLRRNMTGPIRPLKEEKDD